MPENFESLQSNTPTPSFLVNVKIQRKDGKGSYDIFKNDTMGRGNDIVAEIKILQNLFNPFISGYIELYDKGDWTGELNLTTFEDIIFKFSLDENKLVDLKCRIYEAKLVNDITYAPRINNIEKANLYRLEFISEPIFNFQFKENFLKDKDFIGLIAKKGSGQGKLKGLINEISEKYDLKPIEIESTQNGVWIKKDEISLPTGVEQGQFDILHLLNYISSYAISKDNQYAPNFFLWQDLDGWHFKSIEKILKDQKNKSRNNLEYFILNTDDEIDPRKVRSLTVLNQYNSMSLLKDRTLKSYYKRVEPNFQDPYSDFLDSNKGYTYSIIDYDYHRDYNKVNRIENNKLVPKSISTSPKVNGLYNSVNRVQDEVHSYYTNDKYNTPFHLFYDNNADRGFGDTPDHHAIVWWDYLGRTADSRWSNVAWQPQFDVCDLDIEKLHTIETKIREPLREKRREFARKKNIKREWEVYRCAVCCLSSANFGGTADVKMLESLDPSGITYNLFYGPTGLFSDLQQGYKVVAAGSFTDTINYDPSIVGSQNGLTFSYDFTKEPYNQTIGQFYNMKEEVPNFIKYSLEQSLALYDQTIDYYNRRIEIMQSFINNADGYISSANSYIASNTFPIPEGADPYSPVIYYPLRGNEGPKYVTTWHGPLVEPNFYPFPPSWYNVNMPETPMPYVQIPKGKYLRYYNYSDGLETKYVEETGKTILVSKSTKQIPGFVKQCSKEQYMPGYLRAIRNFDTIQQFAGRLWNSSTGDASGNEIAFINPYRYNISLRGLLEGLWYEPQTLDFYSVPDGIRSNYEEASRSLRECVNNGECFNELCFDPLYVEITQRIAEKEIQIVRFERDLYIYLRDIVRNTFIPKWKEFYKEWWNRKSFFASKQIGTSIFKGIPEGRGNTLTQPLSLYNIKKITRKEIKGSRYEILAKSKLGVTGASAGVWLYDIFFGNNNSSNPNDFVPQNGKTWWEDNKIHPYYSQRYDSRYGKSAFVTKRSLNNWYVYKDANPINNGPYKTDNVLPLRDEELTQTAFIIGTPSEVRDLDVTIDNLGYALSHLEYMEPIDEVDFINGFNLFDENIFDKKPPNIKKEEISSYVRIEFQSPIGLDRIADFPDSFVRDAGSEYFLPYLVQVTAGPNGRQTIRNNVVVIGMDPYGFDVAIKKSKVENRNDARNYSWWKSYSPVNIGTDLSDAGMDLWPENGFNVEAPYYTTDVSSTIPQLKDGYAFDFYYWERTGTNTKNPGLAATDIDHEYRQSALGSGYLLSSHKKTKPHRSWWSFYIPSNLYFKQKMLSPALGGAYGAITDYGFGSYWYGVGRGMWTDFTSYRGPVLDYSGHASKNQFGYWWYDGHMGSNASLTQMNNRGDDRWIDLANSADTIQLLNSYDLNSKIIKQDNVNNQYESVKVHTENSIQELHPQLRQYFENDVLHWLNCDYALYRPGLLAEDLWKYDLSGETDYGIITPPVDEANYDVFDQNFAAQFVVFGRSTSLCDKFTCANPNGVTDSSGCPEDNPYCNCPAQDRMPDEPEPTYLELYSLYNSIRECELIEKNLGEEYLGCIWIDPNNPCSCNCPEVGEKFHEYLKYSRTYSTFWSTPPHVPLHRIAYMNQLSSQQIQISVAPTKNVKIGDLIYLYHENPKTNQGSSKLFKNKDKNLAGKWLVTGINHSFLKESLQVTELILSRDSLPVSPDFGSSPETAYLL